MITLNKINKVKPQTQELELSKTFISWLLTLLMLKNKILVPSNLQYDLKSLKAVFLEQKFFLKRI